MASAVPLYQELFSAVTAGVNRNNPPCFLPKSHHLEELKCAFKLLALYWVSTPTLWI
ncbi:unknown [Firmicutes bacterium CAG:24]|nr:unknown [Firmicutes bacterium CAG:24]